MGDQMKMFFADELSFLIAICKTPDASLLPIDLKFHMNAVIDIRIRGRCLFPGKMYRL